MARGYFEVGVYRPKFRVNVGTLWRTAYQLGAAGLFTVGQRYAQQPTDTCKAVRHVPLRCYADVEELRRCLPAGAHLVAVEMGGVALPEFEHPRQAVYLLGAEDEGLPEDVLALCDALVSLPAVGPVSYNVAVAGSIVLYDRLYGAKGLEKEQENG